MKREGHVRDVTCDYDLNCPLNIKIYHIKILILNLDYFKEGLVHNILKAVRVRQKISYQKWGLEMTTELNQFSISVVETTNIFCFYH